MHDDFYPKLAQREILLVVIGVIFVAIIALLFMRLAGGMSGFWSQNKELSENSDSGISAGGADSSGPSSGSSSSASTAQTILDQQTSGGGSSSSGNTGTTGGGTNTQTIINNTIVQEVVVNKYVCANGTIVSNVSECGAVPGARVCQAIEEYSVTENYTDYEPYNKTLCFNSSKIERNCVMQNVPREKRIMSSLDPGKVSCFIYNFGEKPANFTVNFGFNVALGTDGKTETREIKPNSFEMFNYEVGYAVNNYYCDETAPQIEVCTETIVPTTICESITLYRAVLKQRKLLKYRLVEAECLN